MAAAVFDFDGVIARSMEQHAEAYRRVLAPYGVRVEDRDIFLREGARSETILRDLLERAGHRLDADQLGRLADAKQAAFQELGRPPLYEGAEALVREVRGAAPRMGLVTGTRRENLDRLIPDLLPLFDAVLAEGDYERDKPHPEPYLASAKRLGMEPKACVVLENAPRGVQSARAAGCQVVAIVTTVAPEELREAGAHHVVQDHREAAETVLRLLPHT